MSSSTPTQDTLSVDLVDLEFASRLFQRIYMISLRDRDLVKSVTDDEAGRNWSRISDVLRDECRNSFPTGTINLTKTAGSKKLRDVIVTTAKACIRSGLFDSPRLTATRSHQAAKNLKVEELADDFKKILTSVRESSNIELLPTDAFADLVDSIKYLYGTDDDCESHRDSKQKILSNLYPFFVEITANRLSDKINTVFSTQSEEFHAHVHTTKGWAASLEAAQQIVESNIENGVFESKMCNPETRDEQLRSAISRKTSELRRQMPTVDSEATEAELDAAIYREVTSLRATRSR